MRAPRHLRGGPAQPPRTPHAPLPGYLCELCQDAAAVQWQPDPEGGEMGVCQDCAAGAHGDEPRGDVCMAELTISEAAQACGVNRSTLQRAVQAGPALLVDFP